mmetsp:Transcript_20641/g.46825  ORF Transcript_20641/g.46825 Transcript_20641/m.46825 type:complete len:97 (+) Transcript_20641:440-730(+)
MSHVSRKKATSEDMAATDDEGREARGEGKEATGDRREATGDKRQARSFSMESGRLWSLSGLFIKNRPIVFLDTRSVHCIIICNTFGLCVRQSSMMY